MEQDWQNAFGQMTYGIYVLTCRHEETINGMIASWVTQVSYDPPLIMVAVHPNRFSHELLKKNPVFALHVLDISQKAMLGRFKGPVPQKKFSDLEWDTGKTGVSVLKDCLAWFELEVTEQLSPGNHTLFIARVIDAGTGHEGTPLCTLDYDGMYVGKK